MTPTGFPASLASKLVSIIIVRRVRTLFHGPSCRLVHISTPFTFRLFSFRHIIKFTLPPQMIKLQPLVKNDFVEACPVCSEELKEYLDISRVWMSSPLGGLLVPLVAGSPPPPPPHITEEDTDNEEEPGKIRLPANEHNTLPSDGKICI